MDYMATSTPEQKHIVRQRLAFVGDVEARVKNLIKKESAAIKKNHMQSKVGVESEWIGKVLKVVQAWNESDRRAEMLENYTNHPEKHGFIAVRDFILLELLVDGGGNRSDALKK